MGTSSKTVINQDGSIASSGDAGTAIVATPSGALAVAMKHAEEYRQNTKAEATRTAYRGDWRRFLAWAEANRATPLPASADTLSTYMVWLADEGYSISTVERFLSAVGYYHRAAALDCQRHAYIIGQTLEAIRRTVGVKRTKKAPLGLKALGEICKRLRLEAEPLDADGRFQALRNRALLTVGWFCMLRSANLVAIRREHVRFVRFEGDELVDDEENPGGLIVRLPESKTDQRKEGRDVAVYAQTEQEVCPVHVLNEYLRAGRFAPDDLVFPVSKRTVVRLVKRVVANPEHGHKTLQEISDCPSCSSAARRFASHSLRRGSATAQAVKGVSERDIMRQGGWKSERVMRGYIEHATIFQNNPTKDLTGTAAPQTPSPASPLPVPPKEDTQAIKRKRKRRSTRAFHGGR